jgi:hypothetical protein
VFVRKVSELSGDCAFASIAEKRNIGRVSGASRKHSLDVLIAC